MNWNRIKAKVNKWCVSEWMRGIRRERARWDAMDDNRTLLSPKILSPNSQDKNEVYRYEAVRELRNAIDSERCNNIAITGVYGSGKSSVIQTYLAELCSGYRRKRILSISLSNFCDYHTLKNDEESAKYENEIEQKIFQHILYKTNQNKTRQTRFSRISHISGLHGVGLALAILLAIACAAILFLPSEAVPTHIATWYLELSHHFRVFIEWASLAYLSVFFVVVVSYLIRRFHYFKVHGKINADKVQLEWHTEASKFDKLLDEILYFFKAGGYRIVIFEDLDRIQNPEKLFLKLREINILLNESDYYKRRNRSVKFVYAIRDEIFPSDIRTKCFDYIISVAPIVDKCNAVDYVLSEYHKGILANIDEQDLAIIGMYIGGKRELSNILNEFTLYQEAFTHLEGADKKLLAILVYKNACPSDYAAAYTKDGCLSAVFDRDNKEKFYTKLITELELTVEESKKKISQYRTSIRNCRHDVVMALEQRDITGLIIEGREYDIKKFETNDKLFELLEHDEISKYVIISGTDRSTPDYDFKFEQLLAEVYPDGRRSYEEIMRSTQSSLSEEIAKRDDDLREIEIIKSQKLSELMSQHGADETKKIVFAICEKAYNKMHPDEAKRDANELKRISEILYVFAMHDLIEDDYSSYMSHSYDGFLTEMDAKFVNSVFQRKSLGYNWELKNIDAITRKLRSSDYKNECILNYYLVDYLLDKGDTFVMNTIVETARQYPLFVVQYAARENANKQFISRIMHHWPEAVYAIMNIDDADVRDAMYRLYFDVAPCDGTYIDAEKLFVETMYKEVQKSAVERNNMELIQKFVRYHDLKFTPIERPVNEQEQVFCDFIVKGRFFAITHRNLRVIYGEEFEHAAFTQIFNGDKNVRAYLYQDVNELFGRIPESSTQESPETIIALLNDQSITSSRFDKYVAAQENKIDMDNMLYKDRVPMLLQVDIVRPTWDNISKCSEGMDKLNPLIDYVKRHVNKLAQHKCECGNASELESLLLVLGGLTDEEFSTLVNCFSGQLEYEDIKNLPEDRLRILNANKLLCFDEEIILHMSSFSTSLFAEYLIIHFEELIEMGEDFPLELINSVGIEILNSELDLTQKKQYIELFPFDKNGEDAAEYAPIFCAYCEQIGDLSNVDLDSLISAMEAYPALKGDGVSWRIHISLVNQINRMLGEYDRDIEIRLINTIGEHYSALNVLGHSNWPFEKNPENEELLNYLKGKHFVNKVLEVSDTELKVTFKKIDR